MKVSELQAATEIWSLADLDTGTKVITLEVDDERSRLITSFRGMFCEAVRSVKVEGVDVRIQKVSVDGALLRSVLSMLPEDEDVSLTVRKTDLVVKCAKTRGATLRLSADQERPSIQVPSEAQTFSVDAATIRDALGFLQGMVAEGVVKAALTGVLMSRAGKGALSIFATDGIARVGLAPMPDVKIPKGLSFIPKTADLLVALGYFGKVRFSWHEGSLFLTSGKTKVRLALLAGTFPSFARLPKKFKYAVTFTHDELAPAISAASLFDSDGIIHLRVEKKRGTLFVEGREIGTFSSHIGRQGMPDVDILLDARWLEPALRLGKAVQLQYNSPNTTMLLTGSSSNYLFWLSPSIRG